MKNYLDSKLNQGVKEIIGQALTKHYFPAHNQRQALQLFKILGSSSSSYTGNTVGNSLSKKRQICRTVKENEFQAVSQQQKMQQNSRGKEGCCFDSFRPQLKQTQQGVGLKKSKIKASIFLTINNSSNNTVAFEKTPDKKKIDAVRGRSGARTMHSLIPSPQITPKKLQSRIQQKQTRNKSALNSPYQALSKKKIFIGLVSASLTPSRSPLKISK